VLVLLQRARDVGHVARANAADGGGVLDVKHGAPEVADESLLDGVEIVSIRHNDAPDVACMLADNLRNGEEQPVAVNIHRHVTAHVGLDD
jgi:hypothetical protein